MKILVTGGNGFIGKNFCLSDFEGNELIPLVRSESSSFVGNFRLSDGSVETLKKSLDGVDAVVHLATCYIAEHKASDIGKLLEANIQFGTNLLEAMTEVGVNKILNVGTVWQKFQAEQYRYGNLYAATKQAYQEILSWYCDAKGISAINLHLTDTYGAGDTRRKLIQLLVDAAVSGDVLDMSPGEQTLELTHIDDVVSALKIACGHLNTQLPGEINTYSLLAGGALSLREIVAVVEQKTNAKVNVNWGARSYRMREVMTPPYTAYNKLPGWSPTTSLGQGIELLWRAK